MQVRIFTFPFDEKQAGFSSLAWDNWADKVGLISHQVHFFQQNGKAYWTILACYQPQEKARPDLPKLTAAQTAAWHELKNWRKAKAELEGLPGYLIATNKQFEEIVLQGIQTLQALKNIKGYGPKKVEKYGKDILAIIKKHL